MATNNESFRQGHPDKMTVEYFTGCLLGGAVGDALGAAVEFMDLRSIRQCYGTAGITGYGSAYGRRGAITDDTQMTLFTAEGLLRAYHRVHNRGIGHPPSVVHRAYLRWLVTQGGTPPKNFTCYAPNGNWKKDGHLVQIPSLHARRAPGNTCISALHSEEMGTMSTPLNTSKGCGGVMRAAPVGLFLHATDNPFELGCEIAAITHGHASGYLSAGFLANVIAEIMRGNTLDDAISTSISSLKTYPKHAECLRAVEKALALHADAAPACPETIQKLGGGWVGEEALAISLYCALAAEGDFKRGVLLAINHSGDSDSTGAITGNILGALLGRKAIPAAWLEELELKATIAEVASDLLTLHIPGPEWQEKYPPN